MHDIRAALQSQPSPSKHNLEEIQRGLASEPDMHEPMTNIMDGLLPLPAKQDVVPTELNAGAHFTNTAAKAAVSSRDVSMANSAISALPRDVSMASSAITAPQVPRDVSMANSAITAPPLPRDVSMANSAISIPLLPRDVSLPSNPISSSSKLRDISTAGSAISDPDEGVKSVSSFGRDTTTDSAMTANGAEEEGGYMRI